MAAASRTRHRQRAGQGSATASLAGGEHLTASGHRVAHDNRGRPCYPAPRDTAWRWDTGARSTDRRLGWRIAKRTAVLKPPSQRSAERVSKPSRRQRTPSSRRCGLKEQDRTTKGKTCSTRTCQGTSDCRLAFLIQSERDAHLYSYIDGAGKARWGYNVPAGATYNTGCKCVPRAGGGMKKARQGGKKKGQQAGGKKTVRRKTAKSAR